MSRLFFGLWYVIFMLFLHKTPIVVHITLLSFSGGALPPFCSRIWPSDICRQPNVLVLMIFQTNLKSKYPKYLIHRSFLWWPHICFMQVFGSGPKVSITIKILIVFCPFFNVLWTILFLSWKSCQHLGRGGGVGEVVLWQCQKWGTAQILSFKTNLSSETFSLLFCSDLWPSGFGRRS